MDEQWQLVGQQIENQQVYKVGQVQYYGIYCVVRRENDVDCGFFFYLVCFVQYKFYCFWQWCDMVQDSSNVLCWVLFYYQIVDGFWQQEY